MIIDLKGMETTVLPNFKGGEKEYKAKMYFDGTTRIMHGTLEAGASIGYHKHETNSFYRLPQARNQQRNYVLCLGEGQGTF